jgi:hypothetical protein
MSRTRSEMLSILLEELELTNTELARLCEVPPATVQGWRSGAEPIPMAVVRMCGLLELGRRNDMLPDCWPGDWSPPPAAIGQTIRRRRRGQQPGAAAAELEDEALSKETRTTDPTLQRLICLERQVAHNQGAFDFLIECLGPKILELMGEFDMATALPDEFNMATALANARRHASAKPSPPPPKPQYREGLRLISAGLPNPPPTAATSPFGSAEPRRRRRRIAPPED